MAAVTILYEMKSVNATGNQDRDYFWSTRDQIGACGEGR